MTPVRGIDCEFGVEPDVLPQPCPDTQLRALNHHRARLRRTARRVSLCDADADDALQRAALILLTKSSPRHPRHLVAWLHVVTRREALAVRRERERLLGAPVGEIAAGVAPCPSERAERRDRMQALAALKPDERRAIVLRACGYSYAEICELTGWTHTKVNRCLAEGRATLRRLTRHEP